MPENTCTKIHNDYTQRLYEGNDTLQLHAIIFITNKLLVIKHAINLLKWSRDAPTGSTFNNCTLCLHCIYVLCIYVRTNSDLCHLHNQPIIIC
jgi:hypothetical protein